MNDERFFGLAYWARLAFAGVDLIPARDFLLARLARNDGDANALLDLSIVLQLMGQRQLGLQMQTLALQVQSLFQIQPKGGPASVRLLAFLSPGDLSENNAIEFLLEGSDVALDLLYVAPDLPLPSSLPDHDLAMVAVCETDRNRQLLRHIEGLVESWPRPLICAPQRIARLSRDGLCRLLRSAPGLMVPITARVDRAGLDGNHPVPFPIIVRPVDSQKGQGLRKLDGPAAVASYLETRPEKEFYAAPYFDYGSPDGLFRKYRIVLIDGHPYACHMAISDHWMVHYISAGMGTNAAKRAEEARFFADFDHEFAFRHRDALATIASQLELEYVGIDCGETADGDLLVFEADSGMTIHSMDPVDLYPYKRPQMQKVFRAFRQMLLNHAGSTAGAHQTVVVLES
ncbi:MAG TPA: hypothetical protein VKU19_00945 [Bryobacteraceae bacterium]|nr:hypothetical protein [Bryobacteraceae bacterium]